MKVLHINDYRQCPRCPQVRSPHHRCLCELLAESQEEEQREMSFLVVAVVLMVGTAIVTVGLIYAGGQ